MLRVVCGLLLQVLVLVITYRVAIVVKLYRPATQHASCKVVQHAIVDEVYLL